MIWTNMESTPVKFADGVTHVVFATRSGTLADRTLCGLDWRRHGQWLDGKDDQVDCMACVAEGSRP